MVLLNSLRNAFQIQNFLIERNLIAGSMSCWNHGTALLILPGNPGVTIVNEFDQSS